MKTGEQIVREVVEREEKEKFQKAAARWKARAEAAKEDAAVAEKMDRLIATLGFGERIVLQRKLNGQN